MRRTLHVRLRCPLSQIVRFSNNLSRKVDKNSVTTLNEQSQIMAFIIYLKLKSSCISVYPQWWSIMVDHGQPSHVFDSSPFRWIMSLSVLLQSVNGLRGTGDRLAKISFRGKFENLNNLWVISYDSWIMTHNLWVMS